MSGGSENHQVIMIYTPPKTNMEGGDAYEKPSFQVSCEFGG